MQNLSFRYTLWINKQQKRMGHLFQGRYKAVIVNHESYLICLVRYIHLNPVRAGIVKRAQDYPWSGHRTYIGVDELAWLTVESVLGQFDQSRDVAQRLYNEFILEGSNMTDDCLFRVGGEKDN